MLVRINVDFDHVDIKNICVEKEIEDITLDIYSTIKIYSVIKAKDAEITFISSKLILNEFDNFYVETFYKENVRSKDEIENEVWRTMYEKYKNQISDQRAKYYRYSKIANSIFSIFYPQIVTEFKRMDSLWYNGREYYSVYLPGYKEDYEKELSNLTRLLEVEHKVKWHTLKTWFEENGWEIV